MEGKRRRIDTGNAGDSSTAKALSDLEHAIKTGSLRLAQWSELVPWDVAGAAAETGFLFVTRWGLQDRSSATTPAPSTTASEQIAGAIRAFLAPQVTAANLAPSAHAGGDSGKMVGAIIAGRVREVTRAKYPTPEAFGTHLSTLCTVIQGLTASGHFGTRMFAKALLESSGDGGGATKTGGREDFDTAAAAGPSDGEIVPNHFPLPAETLIALHESTALNLVGLVEELNAVGTAGGEATPRAPSDGRGGGATATATATATAYSTKAFGQSVGKSFAELWKRGGGGRRKPKGNRPGKGNAKTATNRNIEYPGMALLPLLGNLAAQEQTANNAANYAGINFGRSKQRGGQSASSQSPPAVVATQILASLLRHLRDDCEFEALGIVYGLLQTTPLATIQRGGRPDLKAAFLLEWLIQIPKAGIAAATSAQGYAAALKEAVAGTGVKCAVILIQKKVHACETTTVLPHVIAAIMSSAHAGNAANRLEDNEAGPSTGAADAAPRAAATGVAAARVAAPGGAAGFGDNASTTVVRKTAASLLETAVAAITAAARQSTQDGHLSTALAFAHAVYTSHGRPKSAFKRWMYLTFIPQPSITATTNTTRGGGKSAAGAAAAAGARAAEEEPSGDGDASTTTVSLAAAVEEIKRDLSVLIRSLERSVPLDVPAILTIYVEVLAEMMHPSMAAFLTPQLKQKLQDYLLLAKTRLSDFGITVTGGRGSGARTSTAKGKAVGDARKIISKYAQSGQIPDMINKCSIFQAKYFKDELVPALLTKVNPLHPIAHPTDGGGGSGGASVKDEVLRRENGMLEQARLNLVAALVKRKKVSDEDVAAAAASAAKEVAAHRANSGRGGSGGADGGGGRGAFLIRAGEGGGGGAARSAGSGGNNEFAETMMLDAGLEMTLNAQLDLYAAASKTLCAAESADPPNDALVASVQTTFQSVENVIVEICTTNPDLFDNAALPGGTGPESTPDLLHPADVARTLGYGPAATVAHAALATFCDIASATQRNDEHVYCDAAGHLRQWEFAFFEMLAAVPWLYSAVIGTAWKLCWVHGRELSPAQADSLSTFALAAWLHAPSGSQAVPLDVGRLVDCCTATTGSWMLWTLRWGCNVVTKLALRLSLQSSSSTGVGTSDGARAAARAGGRTPNLPPRVAAVTSWLVERFSSNGLNPPSDPTACALLKAAAPLLGKLVPRTAGSGVDIPAWLRLELAVDPGSDALSSAERLAYMQNVLYSCVIRPTAQAVAPTVGEGVFAGASQPSQASQLRTLAGSTFEHWARNACTMLFETLASASATATAHGGGACMLPSLGQVIALLADLSSRVQKSPSPWLLTYVMCRADDFVAESIAAAAIPARKMDLCCVSACNVYKAAVDIITQLPADLFVEAAPPKPKPTPAYKKSDKDRLLFDEDDSLEDDTDADADADGDGAVPAGDGWAVESASAVVAALCRMSRLADDGGNVAVCAASAAAGDIDGVDDGCDEDEAAMRVALPAYVVQHALAVVAQTAALASAPSAVVLAVIQDDPAFLASVVSSSSSTHLRGLATPPLVAAYSMLDHWRQWFNALASFGAGSNVVDCDASAQLLADAPSSGAVSLDALQLAVAQPPPFEGGVLGSVLWDTFSARCRTLTGRAGSELVAAVMTAVPDTAGDAGALKRTAAARAFILRGVGTLATRLSSATYVNDSEMGVTDAMLTWVCSVLEVVPDAIELFKYSPGTLRQLHADGTPGKKSQVSAVAVCRKAAVFFSIVCFQTFQVAVNQSGAVVLLTCAVHQLVALFLTAEKACITAAVLAAASRVVLQLFHAAPTDDPVPAPSSDVLGMIQTVNPELAAVMTERKEKVGDKGAGGGVGVSGGTADVIEVEMQRVALLPAAATAVSEADLIIAALLNITEGGEGTDVDGVSFL